MNGKNILIILLLPLLALASEHTCRIHEIYGVRQHKDCFKTIGDTIRSICGPNNIHGKRSNGSFVKKRNALSLLTSKRASNSIACECCVHQCDVSEWLEYCANPSLAKVQKDST